MAINYISTRGGIAPVSFTEAVMMGLATDAGLLLPDSYPALSIAALDSFRDRLQQGRYRYQDLACEVMRPFAADLPEEVLRDLVERSSATFSHPEVVPVVATDGMFIMELFHGPTLAFKDVALQFLGNLFEYLLRKDNSFMNILGATSGDTGSAAIHGVRGKKGINIFILHPHKRVSPVQELQMTTVIDDNVFNIAIKGTFDQAQTMVKEIFADIPFKEKFHLGAVNSINWARVLAQMVYYVHGWLMANKEKKNAGPVDFSVPTGNFGEIFAGYAASRIMPAGAVGRLILATNANDILCRFIRQGDYSTREVVPTSSPSMDIQAASNFERYLYYLLNEDAAATKAAMARFAADGRLDLSAHLATISRSFAASRTDEQETGATIRDFYQATGMVIDPHTACGVHAARSHKRDGVPMVALATAHPAKFAAAVEQAIGRTVDLPPPLATLAGKKTRLQVLDADTDAIREFVNAHARH